MSFFLALILGLFSRQIDVQDKVPTVIIDKSKDLESISQPTPPASRVRAFGLASIPSFQFRIDFFISPRE